MSRIPRLLAAVLPLFALSLSILAHAGQVRVTISGFSFLPATTNVNVGDQVVWVWNSSGHNVVSGTDGSEAGTGRFRSGTVTSNSGTAYSWKATAGAGAYYCQPHWPTMAATLNIVASGADVSNFRITEVEFAATGGLDRIEITNFGTAEGRLGRYRISSVAGSATTLTLDPILTPAFRSVIHVNATGTSSNAHTFVPTAPELPDAAGSFALYVGNSTLAGNGSLDPASLTDPEQLVDYVEWGLPGQAAQPNQATAIAAGFWSAGTAVNTQGELPGGANGYSIVFCGTASDRGAGFWQIARPNFGTTVACATPTRTTSWGRIKSLYR